MFNALLCIPPDYDYNFPPLGTPALCAFLRKKGVDSSQIDLNLKYRDFLASRIYANVINLKEQRFFLKPVLKSFFKEKLKGRYYSDFLPRDSDGTQFFLPYDNNTNSSFHFTERLLSSECLFRYLEDEEENTFLQFYRDTNFLGVLEKKGIKLLGISIISPSQALAGLTLGLLVKKRLPYIHVNIGGQWPTLYRKAILQKKQLFKCFDSVAVFEGETPFFRIVEAIEHKTGYSSITNILTKDSAVDICLKPEGQDLNNLPCPNFDGLPLEDYDGFQDNGQAALTYETSRGCYWSKCAYCVDLPLPKPSYRRKQPDLVAKDIKELREKYNAGYLLLGDPGVSARQMLEVAKSILNEGVKLDWWCMARLDPGFNRNIFDIAYQAGLKKINFGFESASDRACRLLDKGNQKVHSARIIKDCAESGIEVDLQTILGLPQETFEEGLETVNFLLENKEFILHVTFNIYYLTPANFVYLEPEKYGICYEKNDSLPFRFFIPFTNNGGMDKFEAYHLQEIYYTLLSKDKSAGCDAEFSLGQRVSLQNGVCEGAIEFNLNRETHKMHYLHNKESDEYLFIENADKTAFDSLINGSYKITSGAGIPERLSDLITEGLKKGFLIKA